MPLVALDFFYVHPTIEKTIKIYFHIDAYSDNRVLTIPIIDMSEFGV